MLANIVRNTVSFIIKNFYNFKVIGLEKIPAKGKLIIACNHHSNIDPPMIEIALNKIRPVRFIAKKELFSAPIIGRALKQINCIPIDRKKPGGDLKALRIAVNSLKKGDCIGVFPQGTRSEENEYDPKIGIGFLACKTEADVLTARVFRTKGFPFTKNLVLKIGNMIKCSGSQKTGSSKKVYQDFSKKIMSEIFSIKETNAPGM